MRAAGENRAAAEAHALPGAGSLQDVSVEDWLALVQTRIQLDMGGPSESGSATPGNDNITQQPVSWGYLNSNGTVTSVPQTAAEASGVSANAEGDFSTFICSLAMYGFAMAVCVGAFMLFRRWFPLMYSNNVTIGVAPKKPHEGAFGWLWAAWGTTTDEAAECIGLDNALLLEFCNLCMRILFILGAPMFCIMGPVNWIFGGHAAGPDKLSYLSFGNVETGSPLYWIYAFIVWVVVVVVQVHIYRAQEQFLQRRYKWLKHLPEPRSTTVMVEGIPPEYQSDEALGAFFEEMFSKERVKSAYVVKRTKQLLDLQVKRDAHERKLTEATLLYEKNKGDTSGQVQASFDDLRSALDTIKSDFETARKQLLEECKQVGGVNCSSGFVTFSDRRDAELAKMVQYGRDEEEWLVSTPPGPTSVVWKDLQQDDNSASALTLLGYALVAGLYIAYLPCVLGITTLAMRIHFGPFQPLWASFAPTVGLQFMVAFLPTFLILIFRFCFTLKDERWAQQRLQNWYFVFQVVFVILVTAVGENVWQTSQQILTDPFQVFGLLADSMPVATHFYMNFLVLQWLSHAMNLTRYFPLGKFMLLRKIYDDEQARELAEPEDQDYYGIGSRCARFTINMLIGIIFGTLSPPILVLAFINFVVCRTVYGYLIPFAETKKADLGGVFWVHQLKHLFIGNVIYCILMTGVLYRRSATSGPAWIAAPSLLYVLWSYNRFNSHFSWEKLPYQEVVRQPVVPDTERDKYVQKELYGE